MSRPSPLSLILLLVAACTRSEMPRDAARRPIDAAARPATGAELAQAHCGRCHQVPPRAALPRRSWPGTVDLMALYLGLDPAGLRARMSPAQLARSVDTRMIPPSPTLSSQEWRRLRGFYTRAPGAAPVSAPPTGLPLEGFRWTFPDLGVPAAMTSLVAAHAEGGLWVGEGRTNTLRRLDARGRELARVATPSPPIQLWSRGQTTRVAHVGSLPPTDGAAAGVIDIDLELQHVRPRLEGLHRTTWVEEVDLDGDGDEDLLACEFGHFQGRLAWYARAASGRYTRHILLDRPGAVVARPTDFDGDGDIDIIALTAQAREGVYLLRNEGAGRFQPEPLLERHPSFGYTDLHLVDLDGDGRDEVLTINGDNGDLPGPPAKGYHGLRIHRRDGDRLREVSWLRFDGAFRAAPADFDGDGDLDLAVISFFPPSRRPDLGFALFENQGGLKFVRHTTPEAARGHWMTIAAGDVDRDGDPDILLGAGYPSIQPPPPGHPVPRRLATLPALAILVNQRGE